MKNKILVFMIFIVPYVSSAEEKNLFDLPKDQQETLKKDSNDLWRYFSAGFLFNT